MIDIGSRKQLFIDDRFMESQLGITLSMNTPVQHPETVLGPDRPWEDQGIGAYNTVWREDDGRFRMWYDAGMKGGLPAEGARRLCYAESEDGIHWHKPDIGLISFRGSRQNNIVAPHHEQQSMQGATVFRDEGAPAAERYRLWTKFRPNDEEMAGGAEQGLWAMHSADGIRWHVYPGQPNPPDTMCDTQNILFWDDRLELYVGYTRVKKTQLAEEAAKAGIEGRYRSIGRITSPDFKDWTQLEITFEADTEDLEIPVPYQRDDPRPNIDIYTSCAMKYGEAEDVYLMFPSMFYHWGENEYPATLDTQLSTSRDGIKWRRQGGRQPFLRLGFDDSATSAMIYANPWLIPMGDELWLYYSGSARFHREMPESEQRALGKRGGIFRASLRRDGFVSADAGYGGGELQTPLISFAGDRLEVNCDGGAGGWLQVELRDADGRAIDGYSLADADTVRGNGLAKTVTWRDGSGDVGALAGQPLRMRLVMRAMKLYAFQFCESGMSGRES